MLFCCDQLFLLLVLFHIWLFLGRLTWFEYWIEFSSCIVKAILFTKVIFLRIELFLHTFDTNVCTQNLRVEISYVVERGVGALFGVVLGRWKQKFLFYFIRVVGLLTDSKSSHQSRDLIYLIVETQRLILVDIFPVWWGKKNIVMKFKTPLSFFDFVLIHFIL